MEKIALRPSTQLETLTCGNCGIVFAVPDYWVEGRRKGEEGKNEFWCPNGHNRVFCETEVMRLKRELEQTQQRLHWVRAQKERAERETAAARGQVTRLRNRIQKGVCPDCKRSFTNLRRHMASKHPQLALPPA